MPKEFLVTGPRKIEFREYQEPTLGQGEVRIRSILSGISHGTELNLYRGTTPFVDQRFDLEYRLFVPGQSRLSFPLRLGYEMVGEVIEVRPSVNTLKVGDIVHGYLNHRETNVARAEDLLLVPRSVTPRQAVFIALGVVALYVVHDAKIKLGDEVAVFGLGAIGLLVVQMAKLSGAARVYAVDPIKRRRDAAQAFGADLVLDPLQGDVALNLKKQSETKGVDVALECSGQYEGLREAIRSVRMAGRIVTTGYYQGCGTALNLGAEWHHNGLTMVSSMGAWQCPHRGFPLWDYRRMKETFLRLLSEGTIRTNGLITHEFAFEKVKDAYELLDKKPNETIKVVITY